MMHEDEINQTYKSLIETLRNLKMDWVIEEVQAQLSLGKLSVQLVHPAEFSKQYEDPKNQKSYNNKNKGQAIQFVVSEEYSAIERLQILLDAIEAAIIHAHEVARHIAIEDEKGFPKFNDIIFFSEELSEEFPLNRFIVADREPIVRHLSELIHELKKELQS